MVLGRAIVLLSVLALVTAQVVHPRYKFNTCACVTFVHDLEKIKWLPLVLFVNWGQEVYMTGSFDRLLNLFLN